jgi:hypothetical protein
MFFAQALPGSFSGLMETESYIQDDGFSIKDEGLFAVFYIFMRFGKFVARNIF